MSKPCPWFSMECGDAGCFPRPPGVLHPHRRYCRRLDSRFYRYEHRNAYRGSDQQRMDQLLNVLCGRDKDENSPLQSTLRAAKEGT